MSDSKMCRNVLPCQQIKIVLLSLTEPYRQLFSNYPICDKNHVLLRIKHDEASSILLNSTNEADTFVAMYNIIRFSTLSKLLSNNPKTSAEILSVLHQQSLD